MTQNSDRQETVVLQDYQVGGGIRVRRDELDDRYVLIEEYDGDDDVVEAIHLRHDEIRPLNEAFDEVLDL